MNILFLNISTAAPQTGGLQSVSYSLCQYFRSKGHNVVMMSWIKKDWNENGFICLPDEKDLLSPSNCMMIDKIIKENNINIIFNHTCLVPKFSKVVKYLKSKYRLKTVSVFHSSPFGMFGIRKNSQLANINNRFLYKLIDKTIKFLFYIKYNRKLNTLASYSDRISMLSDCFISEFLYFAGNKHSSKMLAICNPLKFDRLNYLNDFKKENILLFVGRLSKEKGLGFLIDIWARIEHHYPNWKLVVVGDGEERNNLEKDIENRKLKNVELVGFNSPEPYYSKAKILCMTSLFEGFGLVLIEAMALGTVPFAFNSYSNLTDIITDGENGVVIPPFDVEMYANKLIKMMNDDEELNRMSLNAYNESEKYDINIIGNKWEQLFEQLLSGY